MTGGGLEWMLAIGITVMLVVVFARGEGFRSVAKLVDDSRPVLWWYVDDVESNARQWLDFGNRDTRDSNEPYLEICWERAQKLWGGEFRLERITGRKEMLERIEPTARSIPWTTADTCPAGLWMPWCRATLLSRFGGLWLDGSVLPFESSSLLSRVKPHDTLAFGVDSNAGTDCPGLSAGWARAPGDAVWTAQARALTDYILGGSWTAFETDGGMCALWSHAKTGKEIPIDRSAEISRDKYGRRLELETLLTETVWEGGPEARGAWVPWPRGRDGLVRASPYGWFLRSSVEQIHASDYVWARWARSEPVGRRIQG